MKSRILQKLYSLGIEGEEFSYQKKEIWLSKKRVCIAILKIYVSVV